MAKKKKIEHKERSLRATLAERIRFSGFFFPKKEYPELCVVPNTILTFFRKQFDENDLIKEDDVEVIYTVNGDLSGYYHIDNLERKVTFVFFNNGEDYKDSIIFKLDHLSIDLGAMLTEGVTLRCCFLPKWILYDDAHLEEIIQKYSSYTCDAAFYSKLSSLNTDMLYKGKLVRSFDKRAILDYEGRDSQCLHDIIIDLRKYKDSIDSDLVINTVSEKCPLTTPSFQLDRLPSVDGRISRYASDIITRSYVGFSKIYIILPEAPEDKLSNFISRVFKGADMKEFAPGFYDRFGFFVSKTININDSEDFDFKPLELMFSDDPINRQITKYIEISPRQILSRYYRKTS